MRGKLGAILVVALAACGTTSHPPPVEDLIPPGDDGGEGGTTSCGNAKGLIGTIPSSDDPTTCAEAVKSRSYVGCDYWPTVLANNVWSIFDFAVVVANAGNTTAQVTVTGPNGLKQSQTIAPNALAKFYLPWVPALKGSDADTCGASMPLSASVVAKASAYHLVSSVPVIVTQFNALEYQGSGGPDGKDWSSCPGSQPCNDMGNPAYGTPIGCYSFSNDASLLLPSSTLTGHYRVTAYPGETFTSGGQSMPYMASYIGITATGNGTHVKVQLPKTADVLAGPGVPATAAGGEVDLTLDAGDVAQLTTDLGSMFDLSGTLVSADQPIQVIAGAPCDQVLQGEPACDHLEQSVFPAETLGKHYFVTVPTAPIGSPLAHVVRMTGNVDGTVLTYQPSVPSGCPTKLDAGQVVDCGQVTEDFEVTGTHEFAVATFQMGGSVIDPNGGYGDPSQSQFASVEQYRVKYVFLAPEDYNVNYVDVVEPTGTVLLLDGVCDTTSATPISGGYEVRRVQLGAGNGGAHVAESSNPVGIQVIGYGLFTSYQYPAGLFLAEIAPPPKTQ